MDGLSNLYGVDVEVGQRDVGVVCSCAVVVNLVTIDDQLQVVEINILALELGFDGIGSSVEGIHIALKGGVGIAWDVFAERGEGDDEGGDGDEDNGSGDDNDDDVHEVDSEIDNGFHGLLMRHEEHVFPVQFLERDPLPPSALFPGFVFPLFFSHHNSIKSAKLHNYCE